MSDATRPERSAAPRPTLPPIPAPDPAVEAAAWARQGELTKPAGSLGRLEALGVQLAALQRRLPPRVERAAVLVCAADHGVVAEGVSAYPREVTAHMVANFLRGGAAINRLAEALGAEVWVLDVGVDAELAPHPRLLSAKVRRGTRNLAREDALTPAEASAAWEAGRRAAAQALAGGAEVFVPGDMGIGNTTAAAALVAALTGAAPEAVIGPGTGVGAEGRARKRAAVAAALARLDATADPWARAAAVGGLELLAIAGATVEAAARGAVVLLDGFPVTAGALVAAALAPAVRPWLVAGHRSAEPGHAVALGALGLTPLLDLGLRLGEGTGAVLALPLLRAAAAVFRMATFAEAGVARA
jgi:nicotinate-nucleotide--dimethylbenzimidazole phosphoribosyltransferase